MKKIICYGDSNTFGYNPFDGSRFDENVRWTSLLQQNLGNEYTVINEGACDRTGFVYNPKGDFYSAQKHFPTLMENSENTDNTIQEAIKQEVPSQEDNKNQEIQPTNEPIVPVLRPEVQPQEVQTKE